MSGKIYGDAGRLRRGGVWHMGHGRSTALEFVRYYLEPLLAEQAS
jgi:hypothetical protein